jgi:hypothetical protein
MLLREPVMDLSYDTWLHGIIQGSVSALLNFARLSNMIPGGLVRMGLLLVYDGKMATIKG